MDGLVPLIGRWNATLSASENGFHAMSCLQSRFATVPVQRNLRDLALFAGEPRDTVPET